MDSYYVTTIGKIVIRLWLVIALALMGTSAGATDTEENPPKPLFFGVEISPFEAQYIVRKAVNVRAGPGQDRKKVGKLEKGDRITGIGRAKGGWIAYRDMDKDVGFIYESVLYAITDSTLSKELTGTLSGPAQPKCSYTISFIGKSEAEGQVFQIGDYEVDWVCEQNNQTAKFSTPMFLTEGPYAPNNRAMHQITIDILDLAINLEEVLSTNLYYNPEKREVTYDGTSNRRMARTPAETTAKASSVSDALHASVRLAYEAWNDHLWAELLKR